MDERDAVLEFLMGSETRRDVLQRLATDGPCRQPVLADTLGVSNRTVKRALDDIEGRQWAVSTPSGYVLTVLGEHVVDTYERATHALADATALEPFLTRLRADACDVPVDAFEDPEVVEATKSSPNAPIERALSFRQTAEHLRELSSIVAKESASQLHQRILDDDVSGVEVVLERDVVDTIETHEEYSQSFEDIVDTDVATAYVHDGPFPFLLALTDRRVALGATNDDGFPAVLVVSECPEVHDWAESVYERFRDEATPVPR